MLVRCVLVACALAWTSAGHAEQPSFSSRTWTEIVDAYLDGRAADAARALLTRGPDTIARDARTAYERWQRDARTADDQAQRRTRRRLQASALLPLEILLTIRMPTSASPLLGLERASQDAWERLEAYERPGGARDLEATLRMRQFRSWWSLGRQQVLVATARYEEFQQASRVTGTPSDPDAAAEHFFLRGLAAETMARLAEEPTVGAGSRAEAPKPRAPFIADTLGDAQREYTRALQFAPSHAEAALRLSRVHLELDRLAQARDTLDRLTSSPCADLTCGLAWLFLAQVHERLQDVAAASSAYAEAAGVAGVRRAARLGSLALALRADDGDARVMTADLASSAHDASARTAPDAWALYVSGQRVDDDVTVRRMKALLEP